METYYYLKRLKRKTKRALAVEFFEEGRLSLESSAKLAGMHLSDFMTFLAKKKIPIVDYSDEEIEELKMDVESIKTL